MSLYTPPDLIVAGGAPDVGVVSIVAASVAAPGAGRRLRIWGWSAAMFSAAPAAAHARFTIANPAGIGFDSISFTTPGQGETGGSRHFPGGLARPVNEGVSIFGQASAAANTYWLTILYTIEDV